MPPVPPSDQALPTRELRRLVEAPLRRPLLVILPLLVCLAAAVAVSFVLPPRYRSSTLILVAPDRLPNNFVPQMNTETISRRLQTLRQEVQSRTRLEVVIRELDPDGSLGREPLIQIIERMRSRVMVSVKGNDAFSIEFEHPNPKMAMLVADRLTTLFMEEVVGARERQVSEAYQFIQSQLGDAREELERKEQALREYKERHMGTLPEQVTANLSTLQRLQVEHQTLADSLSKANAALIQLETGTAGAADATPPPDSLAGMRAALAQLRTRYTDEHPDVRALEARIAALEKAGMGAAPQGPAPGAGLAQRRLEEARLEVKSLRARIADVSRQISGFQARVEAAPRREQEILGLTRDYETLSENYIGLLSKKFDAEMASKLEQHSKGQQFRILDPAYLPEKPSFPDRGLFALAGALLGLLVGVGFAVVADQLDPTVKDIGDVEALLPYPVLAVIPHVKPKTVRRLLAAPAIRNGHRGGREIAPADRTLPFGRTARGGRNGKAS